MQGHRAKIYDDLEEDKGSQKRSIRAFKEEGDRQKDVEAEGGTNQISWNGEVVLVSDCADVKQRKGTEGVAEAARGRRERRW